MSKGKWKKDNKEKLLNWIKTVKLSADNKQHKEIAERLRNGTRSDK